MDFGRIPGVLDAHHLISAVVPIGLRSGSAAHRDRDEYLAENVGWVPKVARWAVLPANAKQTTIGKFIDDAMEQLTAKLKGQFAESAKLEKAILNNLASLGFTGNESS